MYVVDGVIAKAFHSNHTFKDDLKVKGDDRGDEREKKSNSKKGDEIIFFKRYTPLLQRQLTTQQVGSAGWSKGRLCITSDLFHYL